MKTYVLDILENVLTEEEANQYYCKAFLEMNNREKIPYIVNENRYLKFLLRLYKMDKNVVYKFRFFEKWCFDFFSNSEKLHYKNSIKKLRRKALDKKKFLNKDKDILEMIFKMSFRDVFGFQKNYRIYFSNLKILITSLTDYYYFITFLDKDEEKVENLVKKSKLFLRWGEDMELKEQEKFLRIKKEVIKMIENKKEKLKENNIKIDIISDIMNDEENYYILDFESDKGVARLEITTPHFAPYYYACFNILWLNDDEPYWWLDEENSTVTDILKNLEKSLDYFINS